jgi:hypothetical protein
MKENESSSEFFQPMGLLAVAIVWATVSSRWWIPIQDPDMWWLMWAGERIVSGEFPYTNLASYTEPGTRWVLHEPLVAVVYALAGVPAIPWIRSILLLGTGLLVLTLARSTNGWATVMALAPMPLLLYFGLSERAVAWGTVLLLLLVYLLERREETWRLPVAAVLIVLWANTHGSFVLGLFLLVSASWRWGAAAAVGALLNPNGLALYGLLGQYGVDEGVMGNMGAYIEEWAPLDPTNLGQGIGLLWLLGTGLLILRRSCWRRRLVWVCCALLMVRAWRFAPMTAIVLLPWIVEELERLLPPRPLGKPLPILTILLVGNLLLSGGIGMKEGAFPQRLKESISVEKRIWNDHLYGGWLVYHGVPVFWDGRNDCYSAKVFDEGVRVAFLKPGWMAILDSWSVKAVLTRREPLVSALKKSGWRETAREDGAYLLERD